jgi:hypothetical protein
MRPWFTQTPKLFIPKKTESYAQTVRTGTFHALTSKKKQINKWQTNPKEENMNKIVKRSTVLFLITALVFIPFGTSALAKDQMVDEENSGALMFADLVLARPLGIAATVLGCAVFVVSLPFSALGGNTKQASQKLLKEPASFTFTRPLGGF